MKLKPCIIRYILIFSLSFIAFSSSAETYYGVLRGSKTILFKSPYQGVDNLSELREGEIKNNIALFEVKNHEYEHQQHLLNMRLEIEKKKNSQLLQDYKIIRNSYRNGFSSKNDVRNIEAQIDESRLSLKSLQFEKENIRNYLVLGRPVIKDTFLIREIYVRDNQFVSAGDDIMSVELLNNFFIDIKIDPVSFPKNIDKLKFSYSSLVDNFHGTASLVKNTKLVNNSEGQASGLRILTILINGNKDRLLELLDTAFKVEIND